MTKDNINKLKEFYKVNNPKAYKDLLRKFPEEPKEEIVPNSKPKSKRK